MMKAKKGLASTGLEQRAFEAIAATVEGIDGYPYEIPLDRLFAVSEYFKKFLPIDQLVEKVERGDERPKKLVGLSLADMKFPV